MTKEIQTLDDGLSRIAEMENQVKQIQSAMKSLMKEDVHYGVIPGTKKNTLYKAGAEKLSLMFKISPKYHRETIDLPNNHREIIITTNLYDYNGKFLGAGVGSCSTMESKYRYRNSGKVCPGCGVEGTVFTSNFEGADYYCNKGKGGCGKNFKTGSKEAVDIRNQKAGKIENPDLPDQYNTILKMAKKRSLVDAILTRTAASDIFEQDLDEFTEEQLEQFRQEQRQQHMKPETTAPEATKPDGWQDLADTVPEQEKTKQEQKRKPQQQSIVANNDQQSQDKKTKKTFDEWKNEADKHKGKVPAWWVDACRQAGKDLTAKQYQNLEKYLADVHEVKF